MRKTIYIVFFFCVQGLYAQDPVFTQAFTIPETINTGFTGALESTKTGLIHRSQTIGSSFNVNTQFAFLDTWFDNLNTGIGISLLNHQETTFSQYNFTQINFNYMHAVQLSDTWVFRPSISVGVGSKDFGFQNLIFEDQINMFNNSINASSIDPSVLNASILFFDFSSSLLFNTERTWVGVTFRHLNKPNISMIDGNNVPLDIFMSVHASVELPLSFLGNYFAKKNSLYVLSNFMKQGTYNRLDLGLQYVYEQFSLGVITANNPLKTNDNSQFSNSINTFVGLKWDRFKFSYSYDFNMDKIGQKGGAHEILLIYNFENLDRRMKCPSFF